MAQSLCAMPHRPRPQKRLPKNPPDFITYLFDQLSFAASGWLVCIHTTAIKLENPFKWIKYADFNICKQKYVVSNTIGYYLNTYSFGRLHGTLRSYHDVRQGCPDLYEKYAIFCGYLLSEALWPSCGDIGNSSRCARYGCRYVDAPH